MHDRNPPAVVCRSALKHAHPSSVETSPQTVQNGATAPAWLWLPSSQGESLGVSPEHEYDQSIVTVAEVPAMSHRSALPAKSTLSAGYPLTALVAVSTALAPPEANSPLRRHVILQSWQSQLDYHEDSQPSRWWPSL